MNIDSHNLNMMINLAGQKALADKNNDDVCFKNKSKLKICSKCSTELTKENYKRNHTIYRACFKNITLDMMQVKSFK